MTSSLTVGNDLQTLLHESLLVTGHVECCALIHRRDKTVVASSVGFEPSAELVGVILSAFRSPVSARENGVRFNGASYKCIRADKDAVYAKKEMSGFVAVRTKGLVVFGSYSSTMYPSVCAEAAEKLGEYLREKGK